jgi:hypothetical protein
VAEQDRGTDDPRLAAIARHALHDEELIAAFAARDLRRADAERARSLVERCPECRQLHEDLVAVRTAMHSSGTAAQRAATITAPRDFRLSADDAARLRPGSPIGRAAVRLAWRTRLGLGVGAFGRPVGAAMATLGVVGLLVGSLTVNGAPFAAMSGAAGATAAPGIDQTGGAPESSADRTSFRPLSTGKDGTTGSTESSGGGPGLGGSLLVLAGSAALVILGIGLIMASRRRRVPISSG